MPSAPLHLITSWPETLPSDYALVPARLRDQDGALRALRLVVGQHLLQREVADDVTAPRRAHLSAFLFLCIWVCVLPSWTVFCHTLLVGGCSAASPRGLNTVAGTSSCL